LERLARLMRALSQATIQLDEFKRNPSKALELMTPEQRRSEEKFQLEQWKASQQHESKMKLAIEVATERTAHNWQLKLADSDNKTKDMERECERLRDELKQCQRDRDDAKFTCDQKIFQHSLDIERSSTAHRQEIKRIEEDAARQSKAKDDMHEQVRTAEKATVDSMVSKTAAEDIKKGFEIAELKIQLQRCHDDLEALRSKLATAERDNTSHIEAEQKLRRDHSYAAAEWKSTEATLTSDIGKLRADLASSQALVIASEEKVTVAARNIDEMKEQLMERDSLIGEYKSTITSLSDTESTLRSRIEVMAKEGDERQTEVESLSSRVEALIEEQDTMAANARYTAEEMKKSHEELETIKKQLTTTNDDNTALRGKVTECNDLITKLQTDLSTMANKTSDVDVKTIIAEKTDVLPYIHTYA
jgi:DNA repair exonuclease SbcCD ATPase subunit